MWKILDHSIKGDKYVFKFRWMKEWAARLIGLGLLAQIMTKLSLQKHLSRSQPTH
jgi:hypothetical protein